ncbi:MAG: YraN family protein [Candidatus Improbicoccus devescovinae]|nr:MAG: YraN family protein [Candidatus Improbicoccus devescovinae]
MRNIKFWGDFGETVVKKYLKKIGLNLIKCNFISKYGEIDVIAQDENFIIFVEVKFHKTNCTGFGAERVNLSKQIKILKTAEIYFSENFFDKQPRFDVIEVNFDSKNINPRINHIKNAFWVDDNYGFI